MCHEAEANVVNGWLPGSLASALDALGVADIALATRVVVFPADLGFNYFVQCGRSAADAGIIGADEIAGWIRGLASLQAAGTLFGTVGYFLFTGTASGPA
jgi:hypothetical protein